MTPAELIAAKRLRIAALEIELVTERAVLRGMEEMAEAWTAGPASRFRPPTANSDIFAPLVDRDRTTKGRQPGSISKRWRAALWRLDELGGSFSPNDIVAVVAELEGREMRATDARRQMELYSEHGFVVERHGSYNVTDEFRAKFAERANGPNEIEPSEGEPTDGSETALDAQSEGDRDA